MQKVLTAILPCGILPALDQQISRASELGIFEDQSCLRCRLEDDFPESLTVNGNDVQILPMCTGQIFFHAFCTRIVESHLLGMVQGMYATYVLPFDIGRSSSGLPHTCG